MKVDKILCFFVGCLFLWLLSACAPNVEPLSVTRVVEEVPRPTQPTVFAAYPPKQIVATRPGAYPGVEPLVEEVVLLETAVPPTSTSRSRLLPTPDETFERFLTQFGEANRAFMAGEYDTAGAYYEQVVMERLGERPFATITEQIAAFRLLVIEVEETGADSGVWLNWLNRFYAQERMTAAAAAFSENWQMSQDVGLACEAAITTLRYSQVPLPLDLIQHGELTEFYSFEEVCLQRSELVQELLAFPEDKPVVELFNWITEKLSMNVEPVAIKTAINFTNWSAWQNREILGAIPVTDPGPQVSEWEVVDLDGDGRSEHLILFWYITGQLYGDYALISDNQVLQHSVGEGQDSFSAYREMLHVISQEDLTGDNLPELILEGQVRGASNAFSMYRVFSGHGGTIHPLDVPRKGYPIQLATFQIVDDTGDGLPDLILQSGRGGSNSVINKRPHIWVWAWDGQSITLAERRLVPTNRTTDLLYEANDAFDDGDLVHAHDVYYRLIVDEALLDDTQYVLGGASPSLDIRQFAAFRLMLLAAMAGEDVEVGQWQEWLLTHHPDAPLSEAAFLFVEELGQNNVADACVVVAVFLHEHPGLEPVDGWYADPIDPADVCTLPEAFGGD